MTRSLLSVVGACALGLATLAASASSAAASCPDGDGKGKGGTGLECPGGDQKTPAPKPGLI